VSKGPIASTLERFVSLRGASETSDEAISFHCHSRASGNPEKAITLVIGPEGGIIDYEIELLKAAGCQPIDLGPRILRTETVLPYVVGKLF